MAGISNTLRKGIAVLSAVMVLTTTIAGLPVLAVSEYPIPAGIDSGMQAMVQSKIDSGTAQILERIKSDMTAAMTPLIPQMTALAVAKNKEIAPTIQALSMTDIQPSLKAHVEEQARLCAEAVMNAVSSGMMSAGPQSDPTSAIRSKVLALIPQIQKDAIDRANSEQAKDMQAVQPKIEAIVQGAMKEVLPETQALVLAKLKESVPVTQKAVEEEISAMIADATSGLSEDQKALIVQMRPQFEAKLRPQMYESLFDAVADSIDKQVVDGMKGEIIASIRETVDSMNQYCTNFAVTYGKTLIPPQVDQLGIRPDIEKMIDDSASAQLPVFENRIMAANDSVWEKQAASIKAAMHVFIKTQVMAILNGTSAPEVPPSIPSTPTAVSAPADSANVQLNGAPLKFDVPPVVSFGRVLVPLRAIFEALGAQVSWDAATQTITATKAGVNIRLQPGQKNATRNGEQVTLDVPAQIVNGRTLVPARFVSESFGANVSWNADTRTVIIEQ